jgi:tetratricopeptide (TPR) repeat protein
MIRVLVILGLSATSFAQATSAAECPAETGVAEFTAAYRAWDGARFAVAAELFREAITNAPANATNYYWLGTALFHQMLQLQSPPGDATNRLAATLAMDGALAALTTAVKLHNQDAESHALLGTIYGMKINGNVLRAAWYGPRIARHREQAFKYGAFNPRVQYLLGTCQFYTARKPADWRAALKTFEAAAKLFAQEAGTPAGPLEPRWGGESCLTFIGRCHEELGEPAEAEKYFRKALSLHPLDHMAQAGLKRVTQSN